MRPIGLLAALLLVLAVPVRAQEPDGNQGKPVPEENPLRIDVRVGFADRSRTIRVNRWNPVFIELENRNKKKEQGVKGELRITHVAPVERVDLTTTSIPIELPASSKKLVVLHELIEQNDEQIDIELLVGRQPVLIDSVPFPDITLVGDSAQHVLTVSARGHALGWLDTRPQANPEVFRYPIRFVTPTTPDQLPETWLGWDALDAFLVDDPESLPLTEAQVAALRTFVRLGGTLLVTAGRNAPVIANSLLEDLLPASIEGGLTWNVDADTDLAGAIAEATGCAGGQRAELPGACLVARRGRVLCSAGDHPLAVVERVGLGRVAVVAWAASEPALREDAGAQALVEECLGHPAPRLLRETFWSNQSTVAPSPVRGYDYSPAGDLPQSRAQWVYSSQRSVGEEEDLGWRDVVENALAQDLLTRIPSWQSVFAFLLVYFCAMGPCNYLLFRRLDRLEYAWPASIAIALVFTALAYGVGLRGGASSLSIRRLTVIHAGSGSPEGRAIDLLGLASSGHVQGDFRLLGADQGITRMRTRVSRQGHEGETVTVAREADGIVLRDFRVLARAIRGVELLRRAELGAGVTVAVERGHGVTRWKVVNGSEHRLEAPFLLFGDRMRNLPAIGPEEIREGSFTDPEWEDRAAALGQWCRTLPTHETFGSQSREALTAILANEADLAVPVGLVALIDAPGFRLQYDDATVPVFGPALLVVDAVRTLAPGGFDLPPGLWGMRVVACDRPGHRWPDSSPRHVATAGQEIEVELEPAIWSPGATLRSATLAGPLSAGGEAKFPYWPRGRNERPSAFRGAPDSRLEVPPDRFHPRTGRLRLIVRTERELELGPLLLSAEGTTR